MSFDKTVSPPLPLLKSDVIATVGSLIKLSWIG